MIATSVDRRCDIIWLMYTNVGTTYRTLADISSRSNGAVLETNNNALYMCGK